ncbi:hypothetical protein N5C38_08635 [Pseudomonas chengduensis]|nr:hypothetical protein [Pseudomonas chengduensis]MDH1211120.1 hypothetical protein [Pseudomonas chengduensis]
MQTTDADRLAILRQIIDYSIENGESLATFRSRAESILRDFDQPRRGLLEQALELQHAAPARRAAVEAEAQRILAEKGEHMPAGDYVAELSNSLFMEHVRLNPDLYRQILGANQQRPPPEIVPVNVIEVAARIIALLREHMAGMNAGDLQDALWLAFLGLNGPGAAAAALERYRVIIPSK